MLSQNFQQSLKMEYKEKNPIKYYIYLDYSDRLVGYIIIEREQIPSIIPKISKLHHYKDIKNKKGYIQSVKKLLDRENIMVYLLKCKIKDLKDNLSVFVEIVDFIKKYDYCKDIRINRQQSIHSLYEIIGYGSA